MYELDRSGWVRQATCLPSPNCDARPDGVPIELLVIHNISLPPGRFGGTEVGDLFLNRLDCDAHPYFDRLRGLRVSTHFYIRRSGLLIQLVSCLERAWHAGVSSWRGRERCNDFSLGIELEGADDQPFEAAQYDRLVHLTRCLRDAYPIVDIQGHSDIAPGRKTDPGPAFPLESIRGSALGRDQDEPTHYVVTATTLNIRKGPDASHDPVAPPLKKGTRVTLLEAGARWSKVEVDGPTDIEGWVNNSFIEKVADTGTRGLVPKAPTRKVAVKKRAVASRRKSG